MSEIKSKLTVEQQILVSAVAEELSQTTTIHQQIVLQMLAIAGEHNLNAAHLLEDLGVEMKSALARELPRVVDDLKSGMPTIEALARTPRVAPEPAVMAMEVARSRGLEKPLNQALLNTTNRRLSESSGSAAHVALELVNKLVLKSIFMIFALSFIMLFIIPQFKDMYEEFGIELPLSMQLLILICNWATQFWFIPALILLGIGIYAVIRYPRFFTSFFTRWIPSRWQQHALSRRAKQDFALAWVAQTSDGLPNTARRFVNRNGVGADELERLATAEETESKTGVMEALVDKKAITVRTATVASRAASLDSAAWLLRTMGYEQQANRSRRGLDRLGTIVWFANLFMMVLTAWASIAIFQTLLFIIVGLT